MSKVSSLQAVFEVQGQGGPNALPTSCCTSCTVAVSNEGIRMSLQKGEACHGVAYLSCEIIAVDLLRTVLRSV